MTRRIIRASLALVAIGSAAFAAVALAQNAAPQSSSSLEQLQEVVVTGVHTVILRADLKESQRWRGPGGCGVFRDGGRDYIVYHAYDAWHHGIPTLRIAPLSWSSDGWPTAETD